MVWHLGILVRIDDDVGDLLMSLVRKFSENIIVFGLVNRSIHNETSTRHVELLSCIDVPLPRFHIGICVVDNDAFMISEVFFHSAKAFLPRTEPITINMNITVGH